MKDDSQFVGAIEPMIDAKQAATALRLPYYWFADPQMRIKFRIPHYAIGGLVRYRLNELAAWAARNSAARKRGDEIDLNVGEGDA